MLIHPIAVKDCGGLMMKIVQLRKIVIRCLYSVIVDSSNIVICKVRHVIELLRVATLL